MSLEDTSGILPVRFEFNEFKSRINKRKHGIDFVEAQALWLDKGRVEAAARSDPEPRTLMVGQLGGRHWSAIITYRGDVIRLISVRRSRAREVAIYEDK